MRYFDKAFFKFTFGFLVIVALSLVLIKAASAYASGISTISFVTPEQTVAPGNISSDITIQTQDSTGASIKTLETIDITFSSNSPSGEFLNISGNPVSTVMSKNTSNRTFYYRDSKEGDFVINVKAVGRDSKEEWTASQNIKVLYGSSGATNTNSQTNNTSTTTSTQNSGGLVSSSHSSAGVLVVSNVNPEFLVFAGEDRLTSVGSPINFQAIVKKNSVAGSSVSYLWSFGDGTTASGPVVSHTFYYPGSYVVVLNAKASDFSSVGRLNVKVVDPKVSMQALPDSIEIKNNTDIEINMFNWKVISGDRVFIFPQDTIILPRSSIKISSVVTKLNTNGVMTLVLKDSLGNHISNSQGFISREEMSKKLALIQDKFTAIKEDALKLGLVAPKTKSKSSYTVNIPSGHAPNEKLPLNPNIRDMGNTASVITATQASSSGVIYDSSLQDNGDQVYGGVFGFLKGIFGN